MNSCLVLHHHLLCSLVVLLNSVESKKEEEKKEEKKREDIVPYAPNPNPSPNLSLPLLSLSGALSKKGILWLKDLSTNHLRYPQDRFAVTTKSSAFIFHLSNQLEYLFLIKISSETNTILSNKTSNKSNEKKKRKKKEKGEKKKEKKKVKCRKYLVKGYCSPSSPWCYVETPFIPWHDVLCHFYYIPSILGPGRHPVKIG